MKCALIIILLFSLLTSVNAQFAENHAIYTTGEVNLGNYVGFDAGLSYVYKESYSVKIGYSASVSRSKSVPSDYDPGVLGNITFSGPRDILQNYTFTVGRVFSLNEEYGMRANILVGVGYTEIRVATNWQKDPDYYMPNYDWDYMNHYTFSFILNPKIEFIQTHFAGLTVSPLLQINRHTFFLGIGGGMMLGVLRKKDK